MLEGGFSWGDRSNHHPHCLTSPPEATSAAKGSQAAACLSRGFFTVTLNCSHGAGLEEAVSYGSAAAWLEVQYF